MAFNISWKLLSDNENDVLKMTSFAKNKKLDYWNFPKIFSLPNSGQSKSRVIALETRSESLDEPFEDIRWNRDCCETLKQQPPLERSQRVSNLLGYQIHLQTLIISIDR